MPPVVQIKGNRVRLWGSDPVEGMRVKGLYQEGMLGTLHRIITIPLVEWKDETSREQGGRYLLRYVAPSDAPREPIIFERADGQAVFPYQQDYGAISRLKPRLLCVWDCGLGKTAGALLRASMYQSKLIYIVGPYAVLDNWEAEASAVIGEHRFLKYSGASTPKERRKFRETIADKAIIAVNFEMLDECNALLEEMKLPVDHFIVDEAHLVSRKGKDRWAGVRRVNQMYPDAVAQFLTGTPILKTMEDLYELVKMVDPDVAGGKGDWMEKYTKPTKWREYRKVFPSGRFIDLKTVTAYEPINQAALSKHIAPIVSSLQREDIMDSDDPEDVFTVPMVGEQGRLYAQAIHGMRMDWEGGRLDIDGVLARTTYLQQIAEGARNIAPLIGDSGKMDYLVHELDHCPPGEKILVWARYLGNLEWLGERYRDRGVMLTGNVPGYEKVLARLAFNGVHNPVEQRQWSEAAQEYLERQGEPYRFGPGEAQFCFGTLGFTSSISINLHRMCHRQFFLSFLLNDGANEQAKARLVRQGQLFKVYTTYILSKGTSEGFWYQDLKQRWANQRAVIKGAQISPLEPQSVRYIQDILRYPE